MTENTKIDTDELDEFLVRFHSRLDFYSRIGRPPSNQDEARSLKNDARRRLIEVQRSNADGMIAQMYGATLREAVQMAALLEARGRDGKMFLDSSRQIWGEPSHQSFRSAMDVLESQPSSGRVARELKQKERTFDSRQMLQWLSEIADFLDLEWKFNIYEGTGGLSVSSPNRTLNVPENREFTELEMFRLPLHELGRHAVSYVNGIRQPYRIMGIGVGGYELTDEGAAVAIENEAGLLDADVLKKYAARTVAVYMMNNDESRQYVENVLLERGVRIKTVKEVLDRVYMSGGFSRDHIYFEGFRHVQGFLADRGTLSDLFIGKVPLELLDEGLAEREEIVRPLFDPEDIYPDFYDNLQDRWTDFIAEEA